MHLKKNLSKHRLSFMMSVLWAVTGYILFLMVITPLLFNPVMGMLHVGIKGAVELYAGLACSLLFVSLFMVSARRYPYSNKYELLVSLSVVTNAVVLLLLAVTRRFYSGSILTVFTIFQILWLSMEVLYRAKIVEYRFAVFPTRIKLTPQDFPEYKVTFIYSEKEMKQGVIDAVIVEDENDLDKVWAARLGHCQAIGVPVIPLGVFLENVWGRIPLEIARAKPDISSAYSSRYLMVKGMLEKLCALGALVFALPVMGVLAAVIKISSGSPVMFNQRRVGQNNQVFVIYKFRTMHADGGNKVTRLGAWLRKFHLDELPQLFNVLKGDLAFVGPRPETPELSEQYRQKIPYYGMRTKVSQGVVGWALIHQGNVAGVKDTAIKLSYDIYYIKHASLFLDAYIVLKSIWLVLFGIEKVKGPNCLGVFGKDDGK